MRAGLMCPCLVSVVGVLALYHLGWARRQVVGIDVRLARERGLVALRPAQRAVVTALATVCSVSSGVCWSCRLAGSRGSGSENQTGAAACSGVLVLPTPAHFQKQPPVGTADSVSDYGARGRLDLRAINSIWLGMRKRAAWK